MKQQLSRIALALAVGVAFLGSLTSTAKAQVFYVSTGADGTIERLSPSGASLGTLVSYAGGNVQGIAVDNVGDVYASVTIGGTPSIQRITPTGTSTVYASLSNAANGLTFRSDGVLFGVQVGGGPFGGNDVGIYSGSGFTPLTLTSSPFAPFFSAQSLAFDSLGNLFVVNNSFGGVYAHDIVKLTPNAGNWDISLFAALPDGWQGFGLAFDENDNLFVTSAINTAGEPAPVRKYDPAGVLDATFDVTGGNFSTSRGLTYVGGSLYAAGLGVGVINQFDPVTGVAANFATSSPYLRYTYIVFTPIPEPSQVLLALAGFAIIGIRIAKRRRAGATATR